MGTVRAGEGNGVGQACGFWKQLDLSVNSGPGKVLPGELFLLGAHADITAAAQPRIREMPTVVPMVYSWGPQLSLWILPSFLNGSKALVLLAPVPPSTLALWRGSVFSTFQATLLQ